MSVKPEPAPLLIACALGIEHLALRSGGHSVRRRGAPVSRGRGGPPCSWGSPGSSEAESGGRAESSGERGGPDEGGAEHGRALDTGFRRPAAEPSKWGADGPVTVLRTGMGPRAAERSVTRALGEPGFALAAVLATGFCAGLAPGMHPGDLVVAEETRDPRGTTPCEGTDLLVKELVRAVPGRTVHTGPLTGSDHVVRGQERSELLATGAIAVDMESAATLLSAVRTGARPVAAVRVVVDAPEHELVRIGTVRGGISAFRVLRAVLPVFFEWHRSLLLPRR